MNGKDYARRIEYYIKGLSFDVRQKIWGQIDEINASLVRSLAEREEGYPTFHMQNFNDEQIEKICKFRAKKFAAVNTTMTENGRPPFFSDPDDTYRSALEYIELLKKYPEEELTQIFGCTWYDYVPEKYEP